MDDRLRRFTLTSYPFEELPWRVRVELRNGNRGSAYGFTPEDAEEAAIKEAIFAELDAPLPPILGRATPSRPQRWPDGPVPDGPQLISEPRRAERRDEPLNCSLTRTSYNTGYGDGSLYASIPSPHPSVGDIPDD